MCICNTSRQDPAGWENALSPQRGTRRFGVANSTKINREPLEGASGGLGTSLPVLPPRTRITTLNRIINKGPPSSAAHSWSRPREAGGAPTLLFSSHPPCLRLDSPSRSFSSYGFAAVPAAFRIPFRPPRAYPPRGAAIWHRQLYNGRSLI
jgi:hypothetical protein